MARKPVFNTPLGQRLAEARERLGFGNDRQAFAESFALKVDTYGSYERGKNEPNAEFLIALRERHKVNLNWLFCGDGEMLESAAPVSGRAAQLLADFQKLPEDRQLDILDFVTINLKRVGRG
ncbi:hypothetical protein SAMN05421890_1524 [Ensifer adhaerens]|nr:hypothetical protein SAMN05421890_1524 [Ensifer adhaerens]